MRRTTFALIAVGTLLAGVVAAQQKARPEVDLQAAIRTETVDGDLKTAIEQYRTLSTNSDRTVAAQALLRMGQCYEKLGSAEARRAYERTVRDFADQVTVVAIAQARLLALNSDRPGAAYRQVWTGPKVDTEGRVSPDGRYLSCVDWDTGDLALHDVLPLLRPVPAAGQFHGYHAGAPPYGREGRLRPGRPSRERGRVRPEGADAAARSGKGRG